VQQQVSAGQQQPQLHPALQLQHHVPQQHEDLLLLLKPTADHLAALCARLPQQPPGQLHACGHQPQQEDQLQQAAVLGPPGPDTTGQHTAQAAVSLPDILLQQQPCTSPVIAATPGRCKLKVDAGQPAAASQGAVERLIAAALSDSAEANTDCVVLTSIVVTPSDLLA
jgi:hypothetical protein